jgi:hypothetical protein
VHEVGQRGVGRVVGIGVLQDELGLRQGFTGPRSSRDETPSHTLSSFDHRVTQWMSEVIVTRGSAMNSAHVHVISRSTRPCSGTSSGRIEARRTTVGQDRPLRGEDLARRDARARARDRLWRHALTIQRVQNLSDRECTV